MTNRTSGRHPVVTIKRRSGASGWGKKNQDRKKAAEAKKVKVEEQITAELVKSLQRRSKPVQMF